MQPPEANVPNQPVAPVGPAPEVKVVLIEKDVEKLQKLLDTGWKVAVEFRHPHGALLVMQRFAHEVKL